MTATESWLVRSTEWGGGGGGGGGGGVGGGGCSETGVQQHKLKQNWLVVSVTVLCWLVAKLL